MERAKGNLIEHLATLPWPAGVVFGVRVLSPGAMHPDLFATAAIGKAL